MRGWRLIEGGLDMLWRYGGEKMFNDCDGKWEKKHARGLATFKGLGDWQ